MIGPSTTAYLLFHDWWAEAPQNAIDAGAEVYRLAVRVLHGTGEYIRLEVTGRDMAANPEVAGILLSLRNGDP